MRTEALTMRAADYEIIHLNKSVVEGMRRTVINYFPHPRETKYTRMSDDAFRDLVARAQDALNEACYARRLANSHAFDIEHYLDDPHIMYQDGLYLRAARPASPNDVVGYHRESFYGGPPETVNMWVPLFNVTPGNSLRYVPCSTLIPDSEIVVETTAGVVERGSAGHKVGLLYAPKRIVGGVQLNAAQVMNVPNDCAALFSGELVHGAGINLTEHVRFSVDLRLIAGRNADKAKPGYFVDL